MSYTIHCQHRHFVWDNAIPPVMTVAPGETVSFEIMDAWDGQLTPQSTVEAISRRDPARVNPVTGPVRIDGAMPGDTLVVRLDAYRPSGWGWTANIPGFGLLADAFRDPALHIWSYDPSGRTPMLFGQRARVPVAPFAGTIGVAMAEAGPHSVIPPRRVGGNMDVRDLVAGSVLYLPVEVEGALFSIGDTHAAQGDGEVCGTAVESPMEATLTFDLIKGRQPAFPRIERRQAAQIAEGPVDITLGIAPDLHEASRDAIRGMIDLLAAREALPPVDAYMLASVAGDLRISQIVDAPNWTVSFHMPRGIFD
jgi:acetamidase/formamidase